MGQCTLRVERRDVEEDAHQREVVNVRSDDGIRYPIACCVKIVRRNLEED